MKVSLLGAGLLALATTVGFAQTAPVAQKAPKPAIHQRIVHQQKRIAKGVRKGQITQRKAAKLEKRDASIAKQAHRMRAANGGRLTHVDRIKLNHKLNRTSRAIYRAKHNGANKPMLRRQ